MPTCRLHTLSYAMGAVQLDGLVEYADKHGLGRGTVVAAAAAAVATAVDVDDEDVGVLDAGELEAKTMAEDSNRSAEMPLAKRILLAGGALYAAILMSYKGGQVFLGHVTDPYDRVVWVGVGMGIPTALCGAVIAGLAAMDRGWDFLRIAATTLLVGNLAIPAAWGVLWLLRHGYVHF